MSAIPDTLGTMASRRPEQSVGWLLLDTGTSCTWFSPFYTVTRRRKSVRSYQERSLINGSITTRIASPERPIWSTDDSCVLLFLVFWGRNLVRGLLDHWLSRSWSAWTSTFSTFRGNFYIPKMATNTAKSLTFQQFLVTISGVCVLFYLEKRENTLLLHNINPLESINILGGERSRFIPIIVCFHANFMCFTSLEWNFARLNRKWDDDVSFGLKNHEICSKACCKMHVILFPYHQFG